MVISCAVTYCVVMSGDACAVMYCGVMSGDALRCDVLHCDEW